MNVRHTLTDTTTNAYFKRTDTQHSVPTASLDAGLARAAPPDGWSPVRAARARCCRRRSLRVLLAAQLLILFVYSPLDTIYSYALPPTPTLTLTPCC